MSNITREVWADPVLSQVLGRYYNGARRGEARLHVAACGVFAIPIRKARRGLLRDHYCKGYRQCAYCPLQLSLLDMFTKQAYPMALLNIVRCKSAFEEEVLASELGACDFASSAIAIMMALPGSHNSPVNMLKCTHNASLLAYKPAISHSQLV
ncbi:hypothetical protein HaLaN_26196 [Haematococcus lacustris]|uniref:Uncharacterized protein n=1 Tax=Haematococcus lacustris TaxID=44745 RepID=A0A6A0A5Y0_HAELA|nr:hypothetical protein HaLaN_26196 [Haematococcus lacustris]